MQRYRWVLVMLCGAVIVAISMGIRQAFGIFLRPITGDLGIGRNVFCYSSRREHRDAARTRRRTATARTPACVGVAGSAAAGSAGGGWLLWQRSGVSLLLHEAGLLICG